jgi:hypothetical protein
MANGASIVSAVGHMQDSDATQVTDRNGNALLISASCAVGTACTQTLKDIQQRTITIQFAWAAGTWTDTIASREQMQVIRENRSTNPAS